MSNYDVRLSSKRRVNLISENPSMFIRQLLDEFFSELDWHTVVYTKVVTGWYGGKRYENFEKTVKVDKRHVILEGQFVRFYEIGTPRPFLYRKWVMSK